LSGIDWQKEGARLAGLYAAMSEEELQEIAKDADTLTEVARAALRAEMIRRGMDAPFEAVPVAGLEEKAQQPPEPVIVGRYRDLPVATIAKSVLESAGIEAFLSDDNVIRLDWLISNALGGIKLLVREEDAASARDLLEGHIPERFHVEGVGEYEQPKCPNCGSRDVSFEELDRKIAFPSLLLKIPIPATRHRWNCHVCGHNWDSSGDNATE